VATVVLERGMTVATEAKTLAVVVVVLGAK